MRRREFLALASAAAITLTSPFALLAQQPKKMRRLGYLTAAAANSPLDQVFEEELRHFGWVNSENITIEYRYAGGRQDTISPLVEELVASGLDAWITWSPPESLAAKQATTQIPLICLILWDPVDLGLVSNLARPGGNVTGITGLGDLQIFAKRLQLLTELVPSLSRVAVLVSTELQGSGGPKQTLMAAAKVLNLELREFEVHAPTDIDVAMRGAKEWGAQGLYTFPGGFTFSYANQIAEMARAYRLPSVNAHRELALAGGLLAYAADLNEIARRGAWYTDKILRGTPAGYLPFEQVSKYELVLNLDTAKALGLYVPPGMIAVADQVIE